MSEKNEAGKCPECGGLGMIACEPPRSVECPKCHGTGNADMKDGLREILDKAIDDRIEKKDGEEILYPSYALKAYLAQAIRRFYKEKIKRMRELDAIAMTRADIIKALDLNGKEGK